MHCVQRAVIFFVLVVYIKCQSLNDLDVDKVKGAIEKGLGDLDINLPEIDLNNTDIPKAEDIEKVLRDKCEKNGAADAVDLMKEEQENARVCVESYVNITAVQEELETAKLTGSMDVVFKKYCMKWPEILSCLDNSTAIARSCMDNSEQGALNRSLEILNDLQAFMCFKDGDRLAMFVAEGGVECVTARKDGVQDCLNKTIGSRLSDADDISVATLPVLLFSDKDCEDFDSIRECVNQELEKCKQSTPANIVDAFFKFLKKQLPCKGGRAEAVVKDAKDSAWAISSSSLLLLVSFLYVRLY